MSDATFTAPGGQDPVQHFRKVMLAVEATAGDGIEAGSILISRIRQRTAQGIDVNGAAFIPYSPGYAKQKIMRLGSASPVDLFGFENHPHMLNGILVKAGSMQSGEQNAALMSLFAGIEFAPSASFASMGADDSTPIHRFEVGFYGPEAERARTHNEGGTVRTRQGSGKKAKSGGKSTFQMPERRFFEANAEDVRVMEFAIGERAEARMKRI